MPNIITGFVGRLHSIPNPFGDTLTKTLGIRYRDLLICD